jgi:DNA-binding SARP family transcriptional activator
MSMDGGNGGVEASGGNLLREADLFEQFPYGLIVADAGGRVCGANGKARDLLSLDAGEWNGSAITCCKLICGLVSGQLGAEGACLGHRALDAQAPLPEVRVDIEQNGAVKAAWITVSSIDEGRSFLFHLRPGAPRDRRRRVVDQWQPGPKPLELRIHTLGQTRIERDGRSVGGEWLDQRPGELLKYLVCERHRSVVSDQIAEALWPEGGPETLNRVRHYVHALRDRLEPERPKRGPSQLLVACGGGYRLKRESVWIDADEFEEEIRAGLALFVQGEAEASAVRLDRGLSLYQGDFLAEDPYTDWALIERDRLREIAARALRALVKIRLAADDLEGAAAAARRLADMEPLDLDVQRDYLEICVRRGHRTEAARRYELVRHRELRTFGREPDFSLFDLAV